jgi:hypothetical protein
MPFLFIWFSCPVKVNDAEKCAATDHQARSVPSIYPPN